MAKEGEIVELLNSILTQIEESNRLQAFTIDEFKKVGTKLDDVNKKLVGIESSIDYLRSGI